MAVEFRLPDLGENIEAGEVVNVLVSVGDVVSVDQPVIELETDKAVIEVPSSVSGTVTAVHVGKGDRAAVGQPVLTVEGVGAAAPAPAAAAPSPAPLAPAAAPAGPGATVEVALPELGEGVHSGDVVGVLVAVGDQVAADQPLIEIEIDKGIVEMPSPTAGRVRQIHVSPGDRASVGQPIVTLESVSGAAAPGPVAPAPAPAAPEPAGVAAAPAAPSPLVPAAPSVRRLAREIGVDIAQVKGSGPGGRISEDDVKGHAKAMNLGRSAAPLGAPAPQPLPDLEKWGPVERQPMSNVRRLTAEHMRRSWTTIPHVTQFDRADVTELEAFRKQYGPRAEKAGGKLTPTAIVLKVVAAALRRFPHFNASVDALNEQVVLKQYCHIGVAVDTPRGLLVPVVRDVDDKNMIELAVELSRLAEKARTGKLAIEDMQGGCFTISNLGGIGGDAFTPIINAPEVAILGVARNRHEPVWRDGQFEPRLMMPLSLSYDHRLIDGADGARFLRWLCEALQNPFLIALEG
ncbi:MAG: 2-oxo acid dehydrogenase subunit E2 [Gemmatimonadota bacterium]